MRNVTRWCLVHTCIACTLLALAGCHDYSWRAEFAEPIDQILQEAKKYSIVFDLPDVVSGSLVLSAEHTLVLKTDAAVIIGPAPGFDTTGCSFAWYVDGVLQAGETASSLSFNPGLWTVGDHIVSIVVTRGGSVWSADLRITVEAV